MNKTLEIARKNLENATFAMAQALEAAFGDLCRDVSLRNPGMMVNGISGMGVRFIHVENIKATKAWLDANNQGEDDEEGPFGAYFSAEDYPGQNADVVAFFDLFDDIRQQYGNGAIFECRFDGRDGNMERKGDW